MSEGERLSPLAKKAARDAARRGDRTRRHAIKNALQADWDDRDADTSNWLDAALETDPETPMTAWVLLGLASRAIAELADETGIDRDEWLSRLLRE